MADRLHADLWRAHEDLARASLETPFVRRLSEGTLDLELFKRYVAQDAFFLKAFFSAYALAAARASDKLDAAHRLHALMKGVLDELELHGRYSESLDIDLAAVTPNPAARAYTDFLLDTGWNADVGEILAAMTPCMRLYAWIGQQLDGQDQADNPYKDWIDTYASDGFEALASELETLLDELASDTPSVRAAYDTAMRCELDFFEAFG